MTTNRMFVIAVDSADAKLVDEFLASMYEHKELRYTFYRKGADGVRVARRIKLLFAYPTDEKGKCLRHEGDDDAGNGERSSPEEGERTAASKRRVRLLRSGGVQV